MVWNFTLNWKIRLFQFLAEISDCGRDFKFGREFQTIKHHQEYGSGEIFCPGREFSIRSIFKTEIIRTKIVDWGFSRYTALPSQYTWRGLFRGKNCSFFSEVFGPAFWDPCPEWTDLGVLQVPVVPVLWVVGLRMKVGSEILPTSQVVFFGGTCIERPFPCRSRYVKFWTCCQISSTHRQHVSVDLATTITWMRKIWGNMCWYVHKFRQGRYRSPKIATQIFGSKKAVFKKCFFRWSETHKTRDVLTTTGTFTRALPPHETLLNLEIWKKPRGWSRRPLCCTFDLKVFVSKDHQITGGTNVEVLKKFIALKSLMKTGRLVFPSCNLANSVPLMAWLQETVGNLWNLVCQVAESP